MPLSNFATISWTIGNIREYNLEFAHKVPMPNLQCLTIYFAGKRVSETNITFSIQKKFKY